jgi:2,4-dienoyl-CoA reductase-like NADH-dependent reductase (Old Yellow Enzyme family)
MIGREAAGAVMAAPAALPHLFAPLQVGPMRVANRIVMAPMERNYANPDGTVSERTIAHYAERARGGVGWICVESTFVLPGGRGRTHQLGLHRDGCVDGFRTLAAAVHEEGAKVGIELHHAGRNTNSTLTGEQPVAPSPVPCAEAGGEVPRELTTDEIDTIIDAYAQAAARAAAAGFDAVELHSAHGYLPYAFLSPLTNQRRDEYGGSAENRARFAVRAIGAIREAVGPALAVGCRFSAQEHLEGGLTLDDTTDYARALEAAGVDYLSVSTGVYASFVNIIPPMDFAPGWLLDAAATIRGAVGVPVIGASRIVDPRDADRAIAGGKVDLVALGRALLTDPELPRKARAGHAEEIVTCIGCNQGCEARISRQLDVTCLVNPHVGRERSLGAGPAPCARRVVVIGGGPAGMEAARTAAERGHEVTLYEREPRLGGLLALAAEVPDRPGWRTYLEQAERRLRASGVLVRLGEEAGPEQILAGAPDAIVIAAGAEFEPLDGLPPSPSVITVVELFALAQPPSGHVVIVGAGAIGLGAASWCLAAGAEVTVVERDQIVGDPPGQGGLLERLEGTGRLHIRPDRELAAVGPSSAAVIRAGAIGPLFHETLPGISAVVLAGERRPRRGLDALAGEHGIAAERHLVGDCRHPRSALEAVYDGAVAGNGI